MVISKTININYLFTSFRVNFMLEQQQHTSALSMSSDPVTRLSGSVRIRLRRTCTLPSSLVTGSEDILNAAVCCCLDKQPYTEIV